MVLKDWDVEGMFYAVVFKPRSWFSFGKQEDLANGIDALYRTFSQRLEDAVVQSPDSLFAKISRAPEELSLSPRETEQSKVQKYVMGADHQCAMTVLPAASAIAAHLVRVLPYVHSSKEFLCCFFGFLNNIKDLEDQVGVVDADLGLPDDIGSLTTGLIMTLYRQLHNDKSEKTEELLLSDLQGQYSFFLYDSERKQAFAARDPSGEKELWYFLDPENGSVAFTNSLEQLPYGEQQRGWREIPPGHYISGRTPTLRQFALTPAQLQMRERTVSGDGYLMNHDEELQMSPPKQGLLARFQKLKA